MPVTGVLSSGYEGTSAKQTAVSDTSMLSKESFLKLLITQLKYQNPLEPLSNTDFIAQMAQFSALEELQNANKNLENLKTLEENRSGEVILVSAMTLLGREIEFLGSDGEQQKGKVEAVRIAEGQPLLVVGGQTISLSKVVQVWKETQSTEGTDAGGINGDSPDK